MQKILVTGGAGYIGSHTCVELLNKGYEVVVVDNLSNSHPESLDRVQKICSKPLTFHKIDILDTEALEQVFKQHQFYAVIHFAGLKAVGESSEIPLTYYENNVAGTIKLCQMMQAHQVKNLVFSSSATVYGNPASLPIAEDFPLSATNPYGRSKLMVEDILRDHYQADNRWNIALLRYFNPVGAHESGLIGEDPNGIPNNLMPYISQVAIGKRKQLNVFGNDYNTHDGTGVRDYIHVVDLAKGHVKAIEKMADKPGCQAYNLGVGNGYSVLDMVEAFARISGKPVPYQITDRRSGDIDACYANPTLAKQTLNWETTKTLEDMIYDTWRWQQQNPEGYTSK
ncbi:UDP-glucose 4-epimerase GalE [Endozoicomonas sp. SM1973]|uniref:UDP-glucose 4-epimerase n=1 Tax=Spartinivicinus marinus TaxID=2994442 RepID=A0A853IE01_9GAMM|nr:UDP-glucose 4-epimerase GalE [Spartinivicinus marinus]MCX4028341.1 UDP-glucose 4-epimerase GalE [Spartinivicinus marinus]NYZ65676.1 UDP-glucose 4-epimerase GalE [Spartinivicinus marinus]